VDFCKPKGKQARRRNDADVTSQMGVVSTYNGFLV
jgi:hypothetical protein